MMYLNRKMVVFCATCCFFDMKFVRLYEKPNKFGKYSVFRLTISGTDDIKVMKTESLINHEVTRFGFSPQIANV